MRGQPDRHRGHDVFEILVHEHADMLMAYLRSLVHSSHAVDELFQETMLIAWRRLDDYDRTRPFGPWLRGIATRLVLEHRRKSARDVVSCEPEVLEALELRFREVASWPGDSFRDRVDRILECLGRLPDRIRETIDLAYARGLLLKQVAASIGDSEEAVKKRLQRGRLLVADCLQEREDAS